MLKILKKETYNKLIEENENLVKQLEEVSEKLNEIDKTLTSIQEANERENSVTITFDDSLQKATPVLKYKPNITDKMVEMNIITSANTDKYSVELALLTMTEEVVSQILDSFGETFKEV
jgi:predicted nuclease with TOPRIM domain